MNVIVNNLKAILQHAENSDSLKLHPRLETDTILFWLNVATILFSAFANFIVFYLFQQYYPLVFLSYCQLVHLVLLIIVCLRSRGENFIFTFNFIFVLISGPFGLMITQEYFICSLVFSVLLPIVFLARIKAKSIIVFLYCAEGIKLLFLYPGFMAQKLEGSREDVRTKLQLELMLMWLYGGIYLVNFVVMNSILFRNQKVLNLFHEELKSLKKRLEEVSKCQEKFILTFSHETRNPLNSMMGNLDLAYEETQDPLIKQYLINAKVGGDMLLVFLNNMLDAYKAQNSKLDICPTDVEILPVIERVWLTCEELIRMKGLRPSLTISPNLPERLIIDPIRLSQMILNLISNATKYTEKGEVSVRVIWMKDCKGENLRSARQVTLSDDPGGVAEEHIDAGALLRRVSMDELYDFETMKGENNIGEKKPFMRRQHDGSPRKGVLRIEIRDTGVGISPQNQRKIFERDYKDIEDPLSSKLSNKLGFYVTQCICEKMNGTIAIQSQLGLGTKIELNMRCEIGRKVGHQLSSFGLNSHSLAKPTAMIVEDSPLNMEVVYRYLKEANVEVIKKAYNGLEAVDFYKESLLNNRPVDIITMDLEMPIMDGKTATKEIRNFELEKNILPTKVIIISGNAVKSEIEECLDKNGHIRADYFIRKPAKRDMFEALIGSITKTLPPKKKPNYKGKVLIIDDCCFSRTMMQEMLTKIGAPCITARSGSEGLTIFKNNFEEIKLIFVETQMEGIDGCKVTQKIREFVSQHLLRNGPWICGLTGQLSRQFEKTCRDCGMDNTLLKPVSYQSLVQLAILKLT